MKYSLLALLALSCASPSAQETYLVEVDNPAVIAAIAKITPIQHLYEGYLLSGVSVSATPEQLEEIKNLNGVKDTELSELVYLDGFTHTEQDIPTYPLQRIRRGVLKESDGRGVGVAIIDTGIDTDHPDLEFNTVLGKNCMDPRKTPEDDHGHGTHVAGIVAARMQSATPGVAPGAKVWAIKVLNADGYGSYADIVCGLEFVARNSPRYGGNIKVVNMSLGGLYSGTPECIFGSKKSGIFKNAVCGLSWMGVTVVVSAGNSGVNVLNTQPAAFETVISVTSSTDTDGLPGGLGPDWTDSFDVEPDDTISVFSNFGGSMAVAAPGRSIRSTWLGGGYGYGSGTSMSAPFVSGAVALYLQTHPYAHWQEVRAALRAAGEKYGHDSTSFHKEPWLIIDPSWIAP